MSTTASRPTTAVAAGFILVASTVAMDPGGWFPFGTSKWHAVMLAIVVATWAAVARTPGTRTEAPRWFIAAGGGLVAVLLLAAIVGREPVYAWIGTPERRLGWLTWVLFGLCCWIGTRLTNPTDRRAIARIASLAMLFAGVYSLVELSLGAPIGVDTVGIRIGGPYGSSAFLGAALCLLIPVALAEAVDPTERRAWRGVGGVAAALGVVALFGSGTRAAFFGIGVAVLIVGAAALRRGRVGRIAGRRTVVVASVAAAAVVAVTVGAGLLGVPGANRLGGNARRVVDVTASSRLDEWGVGVRIVAAHPVLGVGPEGYRTALADGITADYERTYGRDVIPDRAHNGIIDVAAAGGVAAGALYTVLLGGALLAAWRRLRPSTPVIKSGVITSGVITSGVITSGVAAGVIAYAAQQMFLFPLSVIDPIFWLFIGMLIAAPTTTPASSSPEWPAWRRGVIGVVGAVAVVAVMVSAVLDISADRLSRQGSFAAASDTASAVSFTERATRLRPDVLRYHMLEDRVQPMTVTGIDTGLATLDAAAEVSPLDPVVRRRHAERLLDRAIATGAANDKAAAAAAWTELAADANCYRCHLGLGYAEALSGDTERALAAFERATQLARNGDTEAADAVTALKRGSEVGG